MTRSGALQLKKFSTRLIDKVIINVTLRIVKELFTIDLWTRMFRADYRCEQPSTNRIFVPWREKIVVFSIPSTVGVVVIPGMPCTIHQKWQRASPKIKISDRLKVSWLIMINFDALLDITAVIRSSSRMTIVKSIDQHSGVFASCC